MKILDKYLLKTFAFTFASVFVILFFIFILQTVWLFIAELAGKDLDFILVIKFLLFAMPRIIPLVLPLSILLASIMTFGNLAENYEFAAMKSSGISLQRAMKSLTFFILGVSLAAFFFANNVIPYAEYKFINFRKNIAQMKPAMAIAEGQFSDVGMYNIKVNKKSGENGNFLTGITIHKKSNIYDGTKNVIKAKNGELVSSANSNILQLVLNDGYYYEDIVPKKYEEKKKLPFAKSSFKHYTINLDLSKLNTAGEDDSEIANTNTMLNIGELKYTLDSLTKSYKKDVVSFAENIYQRTGINNSRKSTALPPAKLLSDATPAEKTEILKIAAANIASANYSIQSSQAEMRGKQKWINNHWIALYDKFVIAFACVMMFFIGAPLGAIIRKGGLGLPIVFAVLIFIVYHFINTFGKKVAQENEITPFVGCWLSSFILTPLALLLTYRAANDISMTISFEWLTVPLQKIFAKNTLVAETTHGAPAFNDINANHSHTGNKKSTGSLAAIIRRAKQLKFGEDLDDKGYIKHQNSKDSDLYGGENFRIQATHKYGLFSKLAWIACLLSIVLSAIAIKGNSVMLILAVITIAVFLITLNRAYDSLNKLEKFSGKKIGVPVLAALLFGFPFYIVFFFYNNSELKKALTETNR